MSKHTEGEWRSVTDAQGICGIMHPTKPGVAIAMLSDCHLPSKGYVGDEERELGRPERQANAKIMLASPKMLSALQFVLANHHEGRGEFEDIVIAAIEAATGEKP